MLCLELFEVGAHFSIENPKSSYLWQYGPIARLFKIDLDVDFVQCQYGLVLPIAVDHPKQFLKMQELIRTRTSLKELETLRAKCPCLGKKFTCMGSVKSESGTWVSVAKAAGHYPPSLVKKWARAVADAAATDLTK